MSKQFAPPLSLSDLKAPERVGALRRATFSVALSVIFMALTLTPMNASAQLEAEAAPSLEAKVDKAFGVVVGAMASVLFWDVIFWDNDAPLERQAQLEGGTLISDPIGWGVFVQRAEHVKLFDIQGQERGVYQLPNKQEIDRAWLINSGSEVLVRSAQGQGFVIKRPVAGQPVPAPHALSPLPEGSWTMFTELGGELLFGSSSGHIYVMTREADEVKWTAKSWKMTGPAQSLTARSDGRYWLAFDQVGGGLVIERAQSDEGELVEREVGALMISDELRDQPLSVGFNSDQVWALTASGLTAWGVKDLKRQMSYKLEGANTVSEVTLSSGDRGYLITSRSAPAQLIDADGKAQDMKTYLPAQAEGAPAHPLSASTPTASIVGGDLWLISQSEARQIKQSETRALVVSTTLSAEGVQSLTMSGGRVITSGGASAQVWRRENLSLPFIVLWLVCGALFFTLRMRFVNLRLFRHAIDVVRGKYTDPNSAGEVSHFQALTSALSATVGLGNIAGVAIAVGVGGPGATFWMITAGFLGMASKFTECTLGQKYRTFSASGEVMGGAMHYLSDGLKAERGLPKLGKFLAVFFCVLCVGASFGGGNAFQVKQSLAAVAEVVPALKDMNWLYGLIMAGAVGVVILGGIKSIAQTAEKIVPLMCGVYLLAAAYVILVNISAVPSAFGLIFDGAFSPDALYGGAIGVLVVGFKRAAFSNEAGIGSAAIAHAAAKTEYPVREGVVALLEPFIDTIVVCTMTALVIVITGAYQNPEYGSLIASNNGAALTSQAMGSVISFFPYVLSVAVILFAYSTMISWSYYGERCWSWLFGEEGVLFSMGKSASLIYRMIFLVFAFLGSIVTATNILEFSDLMILGMALPNIYGLFLLSRGVRGDLDTYEQKLNANEFPIYDGDEAHKD